MSSVDTVSEVHWSVKLAAWLHDPAEKALILLRADHERDSSIARLLELCFPGGVAPEIVDLVRLADHWASAADRPTLPKPGDPEMRKALNIRFWGREGAVLKHPLDGEEYRLPDMYTDTAGNIEKASFAGLLRLVEEGADLDPRTAFLRLWRLGPESDPSGLGLGPLWRMLPADTRIPDHSIWEHLSLTSAFAGAMAGDPDGNPALLAVSLGPVQSFISQARSTSDLWAGSHLLASMAWEAMKVVCEELGPDAVIFPNLWGVPLVDLWLQDQGVEFPKEESSKKGDGTPRWKKSSSDANPLFTAALPNRFVALVPASRAEGIASAIEERVRSWVRRTTHRAAGKLLEVAGKPSEDAPLREQIDRQLLGFPEVHWAAVPFAPLVEWEREGARKGVKTTIRSVSGLHEALASFHPGDGRDPGFLGTDQWKLLQRAIEGEGITYVPNPGVLYPALYDLLDRVMGAAKTARPFGQVREEGYRCTLCGEYEWLRGPGDEGVHRDPPGGRTKTLWTAVAGERPSWARKGEHLCARCTLKRLWPDIFARRAAAWVPELKRDKLSRYVVSTHTMALARDLQELDAAAAVGELREAVREHSNGQRACLPRKLARELSRTSDLWPLAAEIPVALDRVRETGDDRMISRLAKAIEHALGHRPEAYYAMVLFDGDRMGAWISGTDPELALPFDATWHPSVVGALGDLARGDSGLASYLRMPRPPSPARHAAISSALNAFSLHVVPWVIEELFAGKVLYAGGDDVLAMLPVDDVLPALLTLRAAYSGEVPRGEATLWELFGKVKEGLTLIGGGHVRLGGRDGRLLRMMGRLATASAGVVIAHHQTPLQAVLRELRGAERRAKDEGGRNAFSVSLMKRAGGTTRFTAGFGFGGKGWEPASTAPTPLGALFALRDTLATEGVSRRAAYNILAWLPRLPERPGASGEELGEDSWAEMLRRALAWQLSRQGVTWHIQDRPWATELAGRLVASTQAEARRAGNGFSFTGFLGGLITVAEFLAREGRAVPTDRWTSGGKHGQDEGPAPTAEGGAA